MRFFCSSLLFVSYIFVSSTAIADSPRSWFESRGFDVSACEVDTNVEASGGNFFSISLINSFSEDVRLGYWRRSKMQIHIYGPQEPNQVVKWRVQDFDKFYVLDVVNRRCINTLRFTYVDEGQTLEFSRGMNQETDPLP
jgi:hypothetical protein